MTEKAAQWVNFCRFSLVSLSFINRSPSKLVKMCIFISLTNHITTTFWSDHFYMPTQANIWQKRLRWGSIFADFRLFLSHLSTEVPELGQNLYLDELNQSYYNILSTHIQKLERNMQKTEKFYFCKRLVCKILACFGKYMTPDEELAVIWLVIS